MAHTYWRIYEISETGGGLAIGQISMAGTVGGSNQCFGGMATASTTYGGYVASNSFDGNPSDFWSSSGGGAGEWIQYQFASPVDVIELVIFPRPDYLADKQGLRLFELQYSDDGTTFTTVANWYASTWNAGTSQTFDVASGNAVVVSTIVETLSDFGPTSNATVSATFIESLEALSNGGNATVSLTVIEVLTPINANTTFTTNLVAVENHGLPITYSLADGPSEVSLLSNGMLTANFPSLTSPNSVSYTFNATATANTISGPISNTQMFTLNLYIG